MDTRGVAVTVAEPTVMTLLCIIVTRKPFTVEYDSNLRLVSQSDQGSLSIDSTRLAEVNDGLTIPTTRTSLQVTDGPVNRFSVLDNLA